MKKFKINLEFEYSHYEGHENLEKEKEAISGYVLEALLDVMNEAEIKSCKIERIND